MRPQRPAMLGVQLEPVGVVGERGHVPYDLPERLPGEQCGKPVDILCGDRLMQHPPRDLLTERAGLAIGQHLLPR